MNRLSPVLTLAALVLIWALGVRVFDISPFLLPAPQAVIEALVSGWAELVTAAGFTLKITWSALAAAILSGCLFALAFSLSPAIERAISPIAVALQVTPVVAIAPLILVWVGLDHVSRALLIIAWIVAFFPILANVSLGLKSVDPGLSDLFSLSGASRLQRFYLLDLPSALPAALAGIRISAGLALIGAVVAEFVAGSGDAAGLAFIILEAGNRLDVPRLFAALMLLSAIGMVQNGLLAYFEKTLTRRWRRN